MSRIVFFLFLAVVLFFGPAFAQQMIRVRAGEHGDYSRIVFDWENPVGYSVSQTSQDTVLLTFNRKAALDLSDAAAVRLNNIRSVAQLAFSGNETLVQVQITSGSKFRYSTAGSKVVLDVFRPAGTATTQARPEPKAPAAPSTKPEPKPEIKAAPEPEPELVPKPEAEPVPDIKTEAEEKPEPAAKVQAKQTEASPDQETKQPEQEIEEPQVEETEESEEPESEIPVEIIDAMPPEIIIDSGEDQHTDIRSKDLLKPHVITVSVTEAIGMAAFERDGHLWIILDRPNVSIMPQLTGPQKNLFPSFKREEIESGTAFHTTIPKGSHVYGEGGGLIWRIVVTPHRRETRPVEAQRRFKAGNNIRNGSLFWLMPQSTKIFKLSDPVSGEEIVVVPVLLSDEYAGEEKDYVDLRMLNSITGLALVTKNSEVQVVKEGPGILATHPEGLALMNEADIISHKARRDKSNSRSAQITRAPGTIFNFERWQMGGNEVLDSNLRVLMAGLSTKDATGLVEELITIAKLNMANGWSPEALGFLDLASQFLPALLESPEFLALRGVANALSRKFEPAFEDLSVRGLDSNREVAYWRTYALAGLEDWQQAEKKLPKDMSIIASYPPVVRGPVSLGLAEVALRSGNVALGEQLLALAEKDSGELSRYNKNTWQYLSGEARRQHGKYEEARELWEPLANGFDELYRAKAGLALTEMLLAREEITQQEAIDRLERLRYIWRGDELETRINYRLGQVYMDIGEFTKGLSILRDAATLAPQSKLGRQIAGEMTVTFRDLFLSNKYRKLTPLEAITLYEEFPELTPTGAEGDRLVEKLAETLVEADLLDRASKILDHQVEYRLEGSEAARVSIRLAAIYLIDQEPQKAMNSLDRAEDILSGLDEASRRSRDREIKLLRARALSQLGKPMQAIGILVEMPVDPDVNRLRADIAWRAGEWDEAAEALGQMIVDAGVSPARMLTPIQSELILNRAVALNLADNRVALSQIRERFESQMKNTPRARLFEVLTRPRKASVLADRETLMNVVSEVDIFREFLDTYREGTEVTQ
jgi:tetratricopeptide (TPR) repeat protein